jgi:uracil-DNA glycosylase family 4
MSDDRRELLALVTATRTQLDWWRETGIEAVPVALPDSAVDVAAAPAIIEPRATGAPPALIVADEDDFLTHPGVRACRSLPDLRAVIGDCQRCKLAPHRTQIVFGVGNPNADLVFVGEAPGRDEDLRGEPFVGMAGQLLTDIIVKGMKIRREDVYIANIIKCRPPQNRDPEPDEIAACEPFLKQQLTLIKPKAIVTLGKFAAQCLLKTRTPITRLRGVWADYQGIPLMPTFHPAYLLRNPADKRLVWQDIQKVIAALGLR